MRHLMGPSHGLQAVLGQEPLATWPSYFLCTLSRTARTTRQNIPPFDHSPPTHKGISNNAGIVAGPHTTLWTPWGHERLARLPQKGRGTGRAQHFPQERQGEGALVRAKIHHLPQLLPNSPVALQSRLPPLSPLRPQHRAIDRFGGQQHPDIVKSITAKACSWRYWGLLGRKSSPTAIDY